MMATDPLHLTALESLDLGNVYSADGREHPVTANTPVYTTASSDPTTTTDPQNPDPVTRAGAAAASSVLSWLTPDWIKNNHITARVVIGILAVGILLIVIFRLVK